MKKESWLQRFRQAGRWTALCILLLALLTTGSLAAAQEVATTLVASPQPVPAGGTMSVWLVFLNTSTRRISQGFPSTLELKLRAGTFNRVVSVPLRNPSEAGTVSIPPGGYARREYSCPLPEGLEGSITLSAEGISTNPVVVEAKKSQAVAVVSEAKAETRAQEEDYSDIARLFREHIFGYEPFYFVAGTKSPNAKFQISFKLRPFGGKLVEDYPGLKGFHFAYTQTSLWDWNGPSAPFLDSSYKPEVFYVKEGVDGGLLGKHLRLDLQGGLQHESNGKGGIDSRSLNIAYLEPTVVARAGKFQFSLAPRAWAYAGDLGDNPDIARYRGYVGPRVVAKWTDDWQLSAIGRVGNAWDRGSLQVDLTHRLAWTKWMRENLAPVYLHLQYFWGYGETLLRYNDRTSSFRVGLSLFR